MYMFARSVLVGCFRVFDGFLIEKAAYTYDQSLLFFNSQKAKSSILFTMTYFLIFGSLIVIFCFYKAFSMGINTDDFNPKKWKKIMFTNGNPDYKGIDWLIAGLTCLPGVLWLAYLVF